MRLGDAVIGCPDTSAPDGIFRVSVSGSMIEYAANCGTVTTRVDASRRATSAGTSPGATMAFQPPGSDCVLTSPSRRAVVSMSPVLVPRLLIHSSLTMVISKRTASMSQTSTSESRRPTVSPEILSDATPAFASTTKKPAEMSWPELVAIAGTSTKMVSGTAMS